MTALKYIVLTTLLLSGCMETIIGPEPAQKLIRVSAVLRMPDSGRQPLEGVDVSLFPFPFNQDSIVARGRTDAQGVAELPMAIPPLGANYTVVASFNGQVQVM
ncbi:MAG: hypothetical protein H7X80_11200, partial [bacterium]|nr:hypothetical protein [Candidatus Kapabacteria bacterium]